MNKITIYDVAREAQCSTATVSLVMHNSPKVKAETRLRVLDSMKRLDYVPNYSARSLSTKSTYTLGLIVPNIENPVFSQMIDGAEDYANSCGYNLLLGISSLNPEKENLYLDMLSQKRVDGLILFPTFLEHIADKISAQDRKPNIPIVFCGSSGNNTSGISFVKCDHRIGAYLAVDHLISLGRRRIGFIAAVPEKRQADSRVAGYNDALAFHGIEPDPRLIKYCRQDNDAVFKTTLELLKEHLVDAVFCLYDYMALSVMRAVMSMGLEIPTDIAVVGFDDISISKYLPIPLSTINTHSRKTGHLAAKMLIEQIKNPDAPAQQILLVPELVARESSVPSAQTIL